MAVTDSAMARESAPRIAGVSLTSADAHVLAEFYLGLGFARAGVELRGGPAFARLVGLPRAEAQVVQLALGKERVELVSFAQPGRPYPRDRASNDPWFQHFAIVVASMTEAYRRLCECTGWTAVTQPEPQRLPAAAGGVVAFKFRDPEGHPLELLEFPEERMPPVWRERRDAWRSGRSVGELPRDGRARPGRAPPPFLGIDHSAIVVASTSRSIDFYTQRLRFVRAGSSLNRGPEQARLDALEQPEVEVTELSLSGAPPHLELLCYRRPASPAVAGRVASSDVAATRLQIDMAECRTNGSGTGSSAGEPRLIRDPDGHALVLTPAA